MIAIILVGGKHNIVHKKNSLLPLGLFPIAGEPIIAWITKWLKQQGFNHIIFSAGYGADHITAWANHYTAQENNLFIDVVPESRPLGTAGAAANCIRRYPAPTILIVNGDSLLLTNLKPSIDKLEKTPELDGIIMGAQIPNAGRFGTLKCNSEKKLIAFHEKQSGSDLINTGVYLLRSHLLRDTPSDKETSLEYTCFPEWLCRDKQIDVALCHEPFIDMGTAEALKNAERLILNHRAKIIGEATPFS